MIHLRDLGQFMAKVDKINWSGIDKPLGKILSSKDGWELSYRIEETNSLHNTDYPLQVVIWLRFEGQHVQTWGCESNADNAAFLKYFKTKRYSIQSDIDKEQRVSENVGKEKFMNL